MTQHTHRFWNMGTEFACSCGERRADTRTDQQIALDRAIATASFKVRVNAAVGVASPNMSASIESLKAQRAATK